MSAFDDYPRGGQTLLGRPENTDNCRHGYGLELQRKTKQKRCAYCGVDLAHDYYHWLLLTVDHVIPTAQGIELGIPKDWLEDFTNKVLCCWGCNTFDNRYKIDAQPREEWQLEQFYELRDRVFKKRYERIACCRIKEMRFFDSKPWDNP